MNNKKNIIIGGAAVLLVCVALFAFYGSKNGGSGVTIDATQIPTENAFDVTMEFYNQWLSDTQSTTTDPIASGLINSTRISDEVRTKIQEARTNKKDGDLEPVYCQAAIPERVGGKEVFLGDTEAQVIVLARGFEEKSPYQSVVTLSAVEGKWQITKIDCTQGEVPPEREYDFERSGFLLKSVPAPLNPEYWHLVYEEAGKPGHTLPLFFDTESICVSTSGEESVCNPASFVEPSKVLLQADMLDTGADVRRVTFE